MAYIWNIQKQRRANTRSGGTRGFFGAGHDTPGPAGRTIDYITIATTGDAADFGDATEDRTAMGSAAANYTNIMFHGGGTDVGFSNTIDTIVEATTGNATDFGDLTVARSGCGASCDSTRAVLWGGIGPKNVMDYITMASTGDATDFGDTVHQDVYHTAFASPTRAVKGSGSDTDNIEYTTIATTGNGVDFGDLSHGHTGGGGGSNSTRGVFGAGYGSGPENADSGGSKHIEYVTIATLGNATNFGDVDSGCRYIDACHNNLRVVLGGGQIGASPSKTPTLNLEYFAIATTGNSADFGDLSALKSNMSGGSCAHGGLNGGI